MARSAKHPYYNRRDLIGHWVKKDQRAGRMCGHACCRGHRVHPENYPVILPDTLLRRASDEDLAAGFTAGDDRRQAQILAEMERRDQREKTRGERHEAARQRSAYRSRQRAQARHEERERIYYDAEKATNGYMLNHAGRELAREGVLDDTELFYGPGSEGKLRRYGSDELKEYFASNPRPTSAYFAGKDTRYIERNTARRPRRQPLKAYYPLGRRAS